MSIVIRSGFLAAVASVKTYFAAQGITAAVEVGWRKRPQQLNQGTGGANRVVFMPADGGGTDGGTIVSPRYPGDRNIRAAADSPPVATVRSLGDWERKAVVSVWAVDADHRSDEAAQIEATETLFEHVVRAVHSAPGAFANAIFGSVKWTPPPERSFGLELLASLTFRHPIYDQPRELVFPSAAAVARSEYTTPVAPSSTGDT